MKGKNEEREGMEGRKERTNKRLFFFSRQQQQQQGQEQEHSYIYRKREREGTWAWILGIAMMRLTHTGSQKRIPPMSSAGRQFVF